MRLVCVGVEYFVTKNPLHVQLRVESDGAGGNCDVGDDDDNVGATSSAVAAPKRKQS
jgi:hypothetical protein